MSEGNNEEKKNTENESEVRRKDERESGKEGGIEQTARSEEVKRGEKPSLPGRKDDSQEVRERRRGEG